MYSFKNMVMAFGIGGLMVGSFWMGSVQGDHSSSLSVNPSTLPSNTPSPSNEVEHSQQNTNSIPAMVKKVGPSVVKIETESMEMGNSPLSPFESDPFFEDFFGGGQQAPQERKSQGLGSGFIISEDGYILTNHHVIDGAEKITVDIQGEEHKYEAEVVGKDPELDLAVLKVKTKKTLPVLSLGDSEKMEVGESVVAIGNPYGLDHTVTTGVISAKGRPLNLEKSRIKSVLQTDASINPGNSGGPLLNLSGQVVGINTAINAEAQGIGFAIPINTVKEVLEDLIHKGKVSRPWLGVSLQDLTPELVKYFGIEGVEKGTIIAYVAADSPAEKAGLQQGDVLVEWDKQKISSSKELADKISSLKVGEKHEILVMRDGSFIPVSVTLSEKKYE